MQRSIFSREAQGKFELLTFEQWYARVNAECVKISGLGLDDIGDFESFALFEVGTEPRDAAVEALAQSDFPFEED